MAPKPSVRQLMEEEGLDIDSLAERSGVSKPTAQRAADGDDHGQLNTTSAGKIARALGADVEDINWAGGLSSRGRNAGSRNRHT